MPPFPRLQQDTFIPAENHCPNLNPNFLFCTELLTISKLVTTCFSCAAKIVREAITLLIPRQLEALVRNHLLPISSQSHPPNCDGHWLL
jgi:hypothetical protein